MRKALLPFSVAALLGCGGTTVTAPSTDAAADLPLPQDVSLPTTDIPVVSDVLNAPDVVAQQDIPPPPRDVPPPPPDLPTNPAGLPNGEPCMVDAECMSGVCVHGAGLVNACSPGCARDADCAGLGGFFRCAIDRAADRTRLACAESDRGGADWLQACRTDTDCRSSLCVDGTCRGACATDGDCAAGLRCGPVAVNGATLSLCRVAPITGVTVERYTLLDDTTNVDTGTPELRALIPPDAVSATWTTQDIEGRELFAAVSRLVSPANVAVVDLRTWSPVRDQPLRTAPARYQFNAAMVSSNEVLGLTPGVWRSQHLLFNDRSNGTAVSERRMRAGLIVKRAPGGVAANGWTLRLQIIFAGTRDVNRATAMSNTRLQTAIAAMQRIYRSVGVNVVVNGYDDLNPTDAARFGVIDSRDELQQLFSRASYGTAMLPLYFVRGISSSAGLEGAIGVAGGIPGPSGIYSTAQSGVVVGWETTFSPRSDQLALTMTHECGHFLGLFHTRERLAPCTTAGQMDCSPWGGVDAIADTPNDDAGAARYLMYWQAVGGNEMLSPTQGLVLRRGPLVY